MPNPPHKTGGQPHDHDATEFDDLDDAAFDFADVGYASALMITLSTIVFAAVLVFSQFRKKVSW